MFSVLLLSSQIKHPAVFISPVQAIFRLLVDVSSNYVTSANYARESDLPSLLPAELPPAPPPCPITPARVPAASGLLIVHFQTGLSAEACVLPEISSSSSLASLFSGISIRFLLCALVELDLFLAQPSVSVLQTKCLFYFCIPSAYRMASI